MSNVKLAIRVRPFTEKELRSEKDRIPVVCVLDANSVTITNIKVSLSGAGDSRERTRRYYADYTYDSSCPVTQSTYASQDKVFETIGRSVISSVTQGCSACVLAYGQSATGKTHTMIGTETQRGLIPRLCEALYEQQNQDYTISFLEIYNERVHDLLCSEAAPVLPTCHSLPRRRGNACKDLRVREHPQRGTYVQNLRRVLVHNVEALLSLVEEGVKRRRTAATRRNSTSSRSHALLEITTPHATLHLADLAGSEKASWEGCGGGRQKEGANINKSLVALSNVISALVTGGTGRGRFVPYRDSALTWLLKDCFTGGANTFIIATVSPSAACYGESASTLRWAARARQLLTPRAANNSRNVVSKAALQEQFNQLIAELTRNNIQYIPETGKIEFDEQHWIQTQNVFESKDLKESAKIGNITNIMTRSKSNANHSESTASSIASGSSDVINVMDKNINVSEEIYEEIDKYFGPALERTSSGDNLKVIAPHKHKIRQYKSQEVLTVDETKDATKPSNSSNTLPTQREMQTNPQNSKKQKCPASIFHDNQRAEIVASVTERLYSKLKNKEKHAFSRVESIVDKKIVEPLSELKICTNARQRLMELSKRAIKTRRRIGIPAHTQTRKLVTRVRDQAIEVQTDLSSYIGGKKRFYTINKDVATETVPTVPRYKDIGVGPTGSLSSNDMSTGTKLITYTDSYVMTDLVSKIDRGTQTYVIPPPRKKKRVTKLTKPICNNDTSINTEECACAPVININIMHKYALDSGSQTSDDNLEDQAKNRSEKVSNDKPTPDLLTNHNNSDASNIIELDEDEINVKINVKGHKINTNKNTFSNTNTQTPDFPEMEDFILPKVSPTSLQKCNQAEFKTLILGRNKNVYPYNIVISPPRQREKKRLVTFKNIENDDEASVASGCKSEGDTEATDEFIFEADCLEPNQQDKETSVSDTESSKLDSDSFIWNKAVHSKDSDSLRKSYMPVYKTRKYCAPQKIVLKDCLASENKIVKKSVPLDIKIEKNDYYFSYSDGEETDNISECKFSQRKHGDKFYHDNNDGSYWNYERKLLDSCKYLEASVTKYESYVTDFKGTLKAEDFGSSSRKPKEYLKHLINLRRKVVEAENNITDYNKHTPQE